MSPLGKELFQHIRKVNNCPRDSNNSFNLSSPKIINKNAISISPLQNDCYLGFQKDDFQLKSSSGKKNIRMI